MSEKDEIYLSIFKPLKEYFSILCVQCPDLENCDITLINKLAKEDCDEKKNLSDNFLKALEQFAVNLKNADSPISNISIKGTMHKIFKEAFVNVLGLKLDDKVEGIMNLGIKTKINEILNKIKESVLNNPTLQKVEFKMNNEISLDLEKLGTYSSILEKILNFEDNVYEKEEPDTRKEKTEDIIKGSDEKLENTTKFETIVDNIFNRWLVNSFANIYKDSTEYFNNTFIEELKTDKTLNRCQKKIMEKFFEIRELNNKTIEWKSFWGDASPPKWGKFNKSNNHSSYRLNVVVDKDKNMAKIACLFPEEIKNYLNQFLLKPIAPNDKVEYSYAGTRCSEYKLPNKQAIFDFFKDEILSGLTVNVAGLEYIPDVPDKEPYVDSDDEKTGYKFDDLCKIENFKDNWKADLKGKLYYKKDNEWKEYTEELQESDAKLFMEKADKTCGHLCIFDDATKCAKFFERMMKRDSLSMEQLSEEINSNSFVRSYGKLKENIAKVNPVFVIGTLRMFGFEKYTKLNDDGTKTVKIESFTRWWKRNGQQLNLEIKVPFPGTHNKDEFDPLPAPPANLELFFKLLICFINNNEFVLNPQAKDFINKSGPPKLNLFPKIEDLPDEYTINGITFKNRYKEEMLNKTKHEETTNSWADLENIMKNSKLGQSHISMKSPEDRINLTNLLGLLVGITTRGNIRLSKFLQSTHAYSTGLGYLNGGSKILVGGDIEEIIKTKDYEAIKLFKPCTQRALNILIEGMTKLKNKNKILDSNLVTEIGNTIIKLSEAEELAFQQLSILAKYTEIINNLNDTSRNDKVTIQIMDDAIREYDTKTMKVSNKADSTISMILRSLSDNKISGPRSYYSKLK